MKTKYIFPLVVAVLMTMFSQKALATVFISGIKIGVHDDKEATAKGYLSGYTIIDQELNNNYDKSGEAWVFLGYKTTTDPSKAITGIMIVSGKDYLSGHLEDENGAGSYITFTGDSRKWYRCPAEGSSEDLNRKNGGDYLTIYYTRDNCVANGGSALTALSATTSTGTSGYTYANLWKDSKISAYGNTNEGTTGTPTYLIYKTHTHSFTNQTYTSTQHKYGCAECGIVESYADHTMSYKDNGSDTHSYWCAICGYVGSTVAHSYTYTSIDGNTHQSKCTICGHIETVNHSFEYSDNGDGTHNGSCSDCGYNVTNTKHDSFTMQSSGTDTYKFACPCGYSLTEGDKASFASGAICWQLNGNKANGVWKQNIGTDAYPNKTGKQVYALYNKQHKLTGYRNASMDDVIAQGYASVGGVSKLMAILLGESEDTYGNADVNADGEVNMLDVEALKTIILNGETIYKDSGTLLPDDNGDFILDAKKSSIDLDTK